MRPPDELKWRARIVLLQLLAGVLSLIALTMIARRTLGWFVRAGAGDNASEPSSPAFSSEVPGPTDACSIC